MPTRCAHQAATCSVWCPCTAIPRRLPTQPEPGNELMSDVDRASYPANASGQAARRIRVMRFPAFGLALRVAAVGVVAVAGVGVAATSASAMPIECQRMSSWNQRAARHVDEATSYADWAFWYDLWVRTDQYLVE